MSSKHCKRGRDSGIENERKRLASTDKFALKINVESYSGNS